MTFAELNPKIMKDVSFAAHMLAQVTVDMQHPGCEGCAVLEGLLEAQIAINRAVERYSNEDEASR